MTKTAKRAATVAPKRKLRKKPTIVPEPCPMKVGRSYTFQFPRHNFHGVLSKMELRRLKVESIRDLVDDPLEREWFDIQPLLKRGRFLVTGQDLDTGLERSFYVESMRQIVEIEAEIAARIILVIFVANGRIFDDEATVMGYAETTASLEKRPIPIEAIQIPTSLKRTLFGIAPGPKLQTTAKKARAQ